MKYLLISLLFIFSNSVLKASKVDTVSTYSSSMRKNIKAVVITPYAIKSSEKLPVLYLLHGYSGNQADWISKVKEVAGYADQYKLIIVCPDGNFSSWYFDSPVDPTWKYETYVSSELVSWIDSHYKTINNKSGRAITGLSMGGHGALFLALKHQDVFGAAGSMSGGVDLRPFPLNWDLSKRLGSYAEFPERWDNNSVINLTHLLTSKTLPLIIDCGTEDFFFPVNVKLHQKLLDNNIPHDFITRKGAHNWEYWSNAISYQVLFFSKFFKIAA
ncbi:alpha/beta hydrolase [Dyadobacter subterraneus]|uniref:Esterase family protein n=1 Tax=Dyadobacter subterraneus TaxID=2773304 RepID=A0ABR9W474_9BACT|nr:alpha/beta hydrolase family protein [Dyadobacter subterraneus]MBE9460259.1 esterase family protein [Dyadobacter subterraneus]